MVQYGSTVVHEFGLGEYHSVEEVVEAARGIDQRGGEETRTALGISVARYGMAMPPLQDPLGHCSSSFTHSLTHRSEAFKRGGRPGAQKVMIVITDGESHDSLQLPQAVADSERDNITMYAIAVSPAPSLAPDSWILIGPPWTRSFWLSLRSSCRFWVTTTAVGSTRRPS